jgi:hypothetical protein
VADWTRRRVIVAAGASAAGAALWSSTAQAAPSPTAPLPPGRRGTTQNGWPVVAKTDVSGQLIEGSDAAVSLRTGDAATVLLHVARRFSYEIDSLRAGEVTGYTTDTVARAAFESNYRSGTAVAIRPDRYPFGVSGNYFARELLVVRDILAECAGVVRWGGDDPTTPKESHFQIDVRPGDPALAKLAGTIRGWNGHHGQGAGAPHDPLDPTRRAAAQDLERRQRK